MIVFYPSLRIHPIKSSSHIGASKLQEYRKSVTRKSRKFKSHSGASPPARRGWRYMVILVSQLSGDSVAEARLSLLRILSCQRKDAMPRRWSPYFLK